MLGPMFELFRLGLKYAANRNRSTQPTRGGNGGWFLYFFVVFVIAALLSYAVNWTVTFNEAALFAAAMTLCSTDRVLGSLDQSQTRHLAVTPKNRVVSFSNVVREGILVSKETRDGLFAWGIICESESGFLYIF